MERLAFSEAYSSNAVLGTVTVVMPSYKGVVLVTVFPEEKHLRLSTRTVYEGAFGSVCGVRKDASSSSRVVWVTRKATVISKEDRI